jgi:hypothetical protein
LGAADEADDAKFRDAAMSVLDVASFILMTIGGVVAALAGLVGAKAGEGATALGSGEISDPRASGLVTQMIAKLDRMARANEKLRRAAQWIGLILVLVGALLFLAARLEERPAAAGAAASAHSL